jgi:hypothetical protein
MLLFGQQNGVSTWEFDPFIAVGMVNVHSPRGGGVNAAADIGLALDPA